MTTPFSSWESDTSPDENLRPFETDNSVTDEWFDFDQLSRPSMSRLSTASDALFKVSSVFWNVGRSNRRSTTTELSGSTICNRGSPSSDVSASKCFVQTLAFLFVMQTMAFFIFGDLFKLDYLAIFCWSVSVIVCQSIQKYCRDKSLEITWQKIFL